MILQQELVTCFRDEVERALAFVRDHGFDGPTIDVDARTGFVTATFKGRSLAIELVMDTRDEDIDCFIARVVDGEVTQRYARDETGSLVREPLGVMLNRKGVRGRQHPNLGGLTLMAGIPVAILDFARTLAEHGGDILKDRPSVFE